MQLVLNAFVNQNSTSANAPLQVNRALSIVAPQNLNPDTLPEGGAVGVSFSRPADTDMSNWPIGAKIKITIETVTDY